MGCHRETRGRTQEQTRPSSAQETSIQDRTKVKSCVNAVLTPLRSFHKLRVRLSLDTIVLKFYQSTSLNII